MAEEEVMLMENSEGVKRHFALAAVGELPDSHRSSSPGVATFTGHTLKIQHEPHQVLLNVDLSAVKVCFCLIP